MVAANDRVNALDTFGTPSPSPTDPVAALRAAKGLFPLRKVPLSEWSGKPCGAGLHVVVREDTNTAIGQVGDNYECFPNADFFVPVAEALIEETGARIERFQTLDDGRRAFMRLSWPDDRNIRVGGRVGDIVGRRCILSTAHDGKWAGKFSIQMLRLICSNGMVVPVGQAELALTHTVGGRQQLTDLGRMAPTIDRYVRQFQIAADILAGTHITPQDKKCQEIVTRIMDPKGSAKKTKKEAPNRAMQRVTGVMDLFAGGQPGHDNRAVKGTGWGLYNAAVDYLTHSKGTRGEDEEQQRFKSLLPGGPAAREIVRAWDIVTDGLEVTERISEAIAA